MLSVPENSLHKDSQWNSLGKITVIHQHLLKLHKEGEHNEVAGFEEYEKLLQMVKL